jgi:hypothetical protein
LFLNCRQRQKLKLQKYQSKQQRAIRMNERGKGRKQKKKKKRILAHDNILVHLVSSFSQHNIGKCRYYLCCQLLKELLASCVRFK